MINSKAGFTLIEMLAVVAIISILATIALPLTELAQRRNQEEALRLALRDIRNAIDAYKQLSDQGHVLRAVGDTGYPPNLEVLVDGVEDVQSPRNDKVFLMRSLPRDPMGDSSLPAAQTWALRSYQSPPNDPQPGMDVFDVHSKSAGIGLNGVPYAKW